MKTFVPFGRLVLALAVAGLLAGCASSYRSTRITRQAVHANDFEVVETSTKRLLTPAEMAQLKLDVAKYLEKEGATASGDYYVKIFLPSETEGAPADWVVVRYTRDAELRYSLLASYPANTPGYQPYAAYDYYPYGYDHFSRFSFQYYNDPYYGTHYYFPPRNRHRHRNHDHDGKHDHDHDKYRDRDRDGDGNGRVADRPRFKPIDPVGSTPTSPPTQVTRTRDDNDSNGRRGRFRDNNGNGGGNNFPRHGGTPAQRRSDNPGANSYTPPVRTSSQSTPRTDSTPRAESRNEPSPRTSSQSAPSYSQPATRSETHSQSRSSSSEQREARETNPRRGRLD